VCYMCLCQGAYPKPFAFSYLLELQKEFSAMYAQEVATVARPYAFVRFGRLSNASQKEMFQRSLGSFRNFLDEFMNV
jgi:hypothetical protein